MSSIIPIQKSNVRVPGIIISGDFAGSGKTEAANNLAKIVGYEVTDAGKTFRQEAEDQGVKDFNLFVESLKADGSLDEKIDSFQLDFFKKTEEFIMVGRVGAFLQPNAFTVFLQVDPLVGAQRVVDNKEKDPSRKVEVIESVEDVAKRSIARFEEDRSRYQKIYGIDYAHPRFYELYMKTNDLTPMQVANIINIFYTRWCTNVKFANPRIQSSSLEVRV